MMNDEEYTYELDSTFVISGNVKNIYKFEAVLSCT